MQQNLSRRLLRSLANYNQTRIHQVEFADRIGQRALETMIFV
jgi:hypothetical protein